MKGRFITLVKWEFKRSYRFPVLELIIAALTVQVVGVGEPSSSISLHFFPYEAVSYVAAVTDLSLITGMLFLTSLVSSSVAGAFENGEFRLLLSYPFSRLEVLSVKMFVSFSIFLSIHSAILFSLLAALAPSALYHPEFLLMLAGIALCQFFFTCLATFLSVISRSIKTSMIASVILVLSLMIGLNSILLRYPLLLSILKVYQVLKGRMMVDWEVVEAVRILLFFYTSAALLFFLLTLIYFKRWVEV